MLRLFTVIFLFLFSCLTLATPPTPLYQIDIIVFTHLRSSPHPMKQSLAPLLSPDVTHAIMLPTNTNTALTPYHLLPASASQLRDEYWALNRKPQYQLLFHSSWLQPANNQRPIALPTTSTGGWNVEGTLSIRKSNYYLLETDLLFSAPNSPQTAFLFSQNQRLKPDIVYYLDHPQAGMLIKIHQLT